MVACAVESVVGGRLVAVVDSASTMRLNGWQRLWVVVAFLYLPVVATGGWFAWPRDDEVRWRWNEARDPLLLSVETVTKPPSPRTDRYVDAVETLRAIREEEGRPRPPSRLLTVPSTSSRHRDEPRSIRVFFGTEDTDEEMIAAAVRRERELALKEDEVDTRFETELAQLPAARMNVVGWAFATWALPLLVLYLLGWAIGWVFRGFVKPSSPQPF
jgi:hypothetical protein